MKLEEKLDTLIAQGAEHNALLREHERRSLALEAAQAAIRAELHADRTAHAAAIAPMKAHMAAWAGAFKALTVAGVIATIWKLFSPLFSH